MTKTSQVISFRFSEMELEALKNQQQPGESLSQTAQRLLKESLALPTRSTSSTDYVDKRIAERLEPIQEKLNQLEVALEKLPA
ncbi:hypothetical protein [Iningainema tapete]|uniref:Uncharacterized protein n=1 Tax=Iningainema tapete BLCC-T55 TaxID=2748662 RepID=A0A8J6XJ14_9CYAN|nr:hypothetical protein [Iningainema tapete]MBD2773336.1 hypothetical protein [Iningainema tapete BLCC-T55]